MLPFTEGDRGTERGRQGIGSKAGVSDDLGADARAPKPQRTHVTYFLREVLFKKYLLIAAGGAAQELL